MIVVVAVVMMTVMVVVLVVMIMVVRVVVMVVVILQKAPFMVPSACLNLDLRFRESHHETIFVFL